MERQTICIDYSLPRREAADSDAWPYACEHCGSDRITDDADDADWIEVWRGSARHHEECNGGEPYRYCSDICVALNFLALHLTDDPENFLADTARIAWAPPVPSRT